MCSKCAIHSAVTELKTQIFTEIQEKTHIWISVLSTFQLPIPVGRSNWQPERGPRHVRAQPQHHQRQDLPPRVGLVLLPRIHLTLCLTPHRHFNHVRQGQENHR